MPSGAVPFCAPGESVWAVIVAAPFDSGPTLRLGENEGALENGLGVERE